MLKMIERSIVEKNKKRRNHFSAYENSCNL